MPRASRILSRVLLRFYPASYRTRWGNELEGAMLACVARERRRVGVPGAVYAWMRLTLDALFAGTALRWDQRQRSEMHVEFWPPLFRDTGRDVRYGLRLLRRAPAFTLVSSLT